MSNAYELKKRIAKKKYEINLLEIELEKVTEKEEEESKESVVGYHIPSEEESDL